MKESEIHAQSPALTDSVPLFPGETLQFQEGLRHTRVGSLLLCSPSTWTHCQPSVPFQTEAGPEESCFLSLMGMPGSRPSWQVQHPTSLRPQRRRVSARRGKDRSRPFKPGDVSPPPESTDHRPPPQTPLFLPTSQQLAWELMGFYIQQTNYSSKNHVQIQAFFFYHVS